LGAVAELIVDCEELLDLALSQALCVEVLLVLFGELRIQLVETLQQKNKVNVPSANTRKIGQ
jgi:hypothetical protein